MLESPTPPLIRSLHYHVTHQMAVVVGMLSTPSGPQLPLLQVWMLSAGSMLRQGAKAFMTLEGFTLHCHCALLLVPSIRS